MPSEIDELMDKDPMQLSKQDLDAIIAYHRKAQANFVSGVKPKKEKGPSVDLSGVVQSLTNTPQAVPIKRRF